MSGPPEYQPLSADDELAHLNRSHKRSPSLDSMNPAPTYPPGTSTSGQGADGSKPFAAWTYEPVWPQKGDRQYAMGRIATSHEDAVSVARRAFPQLEDIPEHKFEFRVQLETPGPTLKILDDAWVSLPNMAKSMLVVLTEDKREKSRRNKHQCKVFTAGMTGVLLFITAFVAFLLTIDEKHPPRPKSSP